MISGVRASSMRMESTSSTIAKFSPRCDVVVDAELHVVAEVVEAELVVRAVGDVAAVRLLLRGVPAGRNDHADADAEEVVDLGHPLGVALRRGSR
jgi:hypothetical protein